MKEKALRTGDQTPATGILIPLQQEFWSKETRENRHSPVAVNSTGNPENSSGGIDTDSWGLADRRDIINQRSDSERTFGKHI
jgi:hypothetical protein